MPAAAPRTNDPLSSTAWAGFRTDLRAFAGSHLPAATVPTRFVVLAELPKLPNGKVDRGKLPAPTGAPGAGRAFVPPQTPEAVRLAAVWQDLLGVARVGMDDDFFELGGNSLVAAQLAAEVRARTGTAISLRRFFEHPTLAGLVAQLSSEPAGPRPAARDAGPNPRSISEDELAAEARLPDDVRPGPRARSAAAPPYRAVLLTGGTGYTGAYLLRELLDRSEAEVRVLVRASDPGHAARRVRAGMEQFGLWRDGDAPRLRPVVGDLARPYLGLDRATYEDAAEGVELVVHSGALSSYALPYRVLKPTNVLGTLEVLRLACHRRVKPVHYVSSLAVYPGRRGEHRWPEAEVRDAGGVVGGYRQTKWVGDRMLAEAGRRGLPVVVYRPGLITGAQETGACATDTFINAVVKGCIQLGATFDFDAPLEATPVDFFAAAVAHVALGGGWHGHVLNLPGARTLAPGELFEHVERYGYRLRRLPYRDWHAALDAAVDAGAENELARFLPLFGSDGPSADVGYEGGRPVYDTTNLRAALAGSGIACAPPDQRLFDRYLGWFVAAGYLPPPPGSERGAP